MHDDSHQAYKNVRALHACQIYGSDNIQAKPPKTGTWTLCVQNYDPRLSLNKRAKKNATRARTFAFFAH